MALKLLLVSKLLVVILLISCNVIQSFYRSSFHVKSSASILNVKKPQLITRNLYQNNRSPYILKSWQQYSMFSLYFFFLINPIYPTHGSSSSSSSIGSNEMMITTSQTSSISSLKSLEFHTFLDELEGGNIVRVVFKGINPTSLIAYSKSGDSFLVSEGFPIDDPHSPSGPAQVIAKVQHTPGLICQQDISDALSKSSKGSTGMELRPMLSHSRYPKEYEYKRNTLQMKWNFGMGMAGMQESGLIGNDGEFYFDPQKSAKITGPASICGKQLFIPILPYNSILLPGSIEPLNIFEMRHRQLLNDVIEQNKNGLFGIVYHSQAFQRVSLVGTLAKIKSRRATEDGRISCVVEGVDRFYLEEVVSEKPYFKGLVRPFKDYTENPEVLDQLELQIFNEVQTNLKMMELLLPNRNFTISNALLENRPWMNIPGIRAIHFGEDEHDIARRSKFSYAVMEMLQSQPSLKLSLLQEHILERKYAKCLRVLERGGNYLRDELRTKGLIVNDEQFIDLKTQATVSSSKLESTSAGNWIPENYQDGSWVQMATMM